MAIKKQVPQNASNESSSEVSTESHRSLSRSIGVVAVTTTAMILNTANATAASIALPTIGQDLDIPEEKLQWIVSAYSLSSGCLLLILGRLADLYGRKLVFLIGTLFLTAFSLGSALSQTEISLDVLRGLQGIGGAAIIPASLGILAHAFPPSRARAIAFSTFAAGAPIGGAVGNLIGGVLTQLTDQKWRSDFYFLTGMSAACVVGGWWYIDPDGPSTEIDRRIDWLGAFLVTAGLTLIVFVLSDGSIAENGWKTPYIIALLIVGVILLVLFVLWQWYLERQLDNPDAIHSKWTPPPLMRISIWGRAKGRMAVMLFIAFLEWCSFLSWTFWTQLYYQSYEGLSPILTMIRLIPMFVTGILCNVIVALVVGRVDVVILVIIGTTFTAAASILFALIKTSAPYWAFGFPAAIVSVFGADFVFASGTLFVAKISLPHEQSLAGALFQTMTQLGSSFGLAITTIIYNSTLAKESGKLGVEVNRAGSNAPRSAQLIAYRDAFWGSCAFGLFGALLAVVFLRGVGIVGHKNPPKEDVTAVDEEKVVDEHKVDGRSVDEARGRVPSEVGTAFESRRASQESKA